MWSASTPPCPEGVQWNLKNIQGSPGLDTETLLPTIQAHNQLTIPTTQLAHWTLDQETQDFTTQLLNKEDL